MKKRYLSILPLILFGITSFGPKNCELRSDKSKYFCSPINISGTDSLEKIPDKLVVLTFDDAVASHYTLVRPILKQYGFSATFFITEGFNFFTNKTAYLTWDKIAILNKDGFEIGNHTRDHLSITPEIVNQLKEQIEAINDACKQHGIPKPVSFAYPGNIILADALPILREEGIIWARRGNIPEYGGGDDGRGFGYEPGNDDPLLIPSAGIALPAWTIEDFKKAVGKAHDGKIAVIQFHGVPDLEHQWVNTTPEQFRSYMEYLHKNDFHVIALRDLRRYVDPNIHPEDPWTVIERRKKNQE
jgi:peptidoglycan/xylan/chitin deacetylase (PgdA/CDA1 family)